MVGVGGGVTVGVGFFEQHSGGGIMGPPRGIACGVGIAVGAHFVLLAVVVVSIGHAVSAVTLGLDNLSTVVIESLRDFIFGVGGGPWQSCGGIVSGMIGIAGRFSRVVRGGFKLAGGVIGISGGGSGG